MPSFEYSVIPAPERGERAKGLKTPADRFAHVLSAEINRMAAEGWEYVRAETLPSEERAGLTGRQTVYLNLLIFRRPLAPVATVEPVQPAALPHPDHATPSPSAPVPAEADAEHPPAPNGAAAEIPPLRPPVAPSEEKSA